MSTIKQLRTKIVATDTAIIKKLAERKKISHDIQQLKAKSGRKILDVAREKELMKIHKKLCLQYKLQVKFVNRLYKYIIADSRRS
jgi:chorismate mutase